MKFTLARAARPRNPLVTPALFRRAGVHRPDGGSQRQQARRALQRELSRTGMARCDTHSP